MKFAPIVPLSALPLIKEHTYFLVLTHLALASPSYTRFYAETTQGEGFRILDNSVYELGTALTGDSLQLAVKETSPDVLVVPDSMWDAEENLRLAKEFERTARDFWLFSAPGLRFMAVPHGLSAKELEQNLEDLLTLEYVDWIGLSKSARKFKLRSKLAKRAAESGRSVHFLGVWEDPVAEVLEGKELAWAVRGIDTSYVTRLGLLGRTLLEYNPTPPALDFFQEEETYDPSWLKRQLEACRWLAEGPASTVQELRQEYLNGRF